MSGPALAVLSVCALVVFMIAVEEVLILRRKK